MLYQILQINYFLFHFNKHIGLFSDMYMNTLCIPHFSYKRRKLIGQNKVNI